MSKMNVFRTDLVRLCQISLVLLLGFGVNAQAFAQTNLEVEPGLTIPNSKTPWALDVFNGKKELVPIHYSTVALNKHTGSNTAGALTQSFFYKPKLTTELDGPTSRNHLHIGNTTIYVLFDTDQDPDGQNKSTDLYDLVMAPTELVKGKRIVDRLAFTPLTGHASRDKKLIEVEITHLKDSWLKIHPKSPLAEGEYVLMAAPKINGTYSSIVWDFGIHSDASNSSDAIEQKQ